MDIWKQMNNIQKTNDKSCLYDDYYIRRQKKLNSLYEERDKIKKKEMIFRVQEKIFDIKKKVIEIRESNRFSVPKYIMNRYPVIFNINIF